MEALLPGAASVPLTLKSVIQEATQLDTENPFANRTGMRPVFAMHGSFLVHTTLSLYRHLLFRSHTGQQTVGLARTKRRFKLSVRYTFNLPMSRSFPPCKQGSKVSAFSSSSKRWMYRSPIPCEGNWRELGTRRRISRIRTLLGKLCCNFFFSNSKPPSHEVEKDKPRYVLLHYEFGIAFVVNLLWLEDPDLPRMKQLRQWPGMEDHPYIRQIHGGKFLSIAVQVPPTSQENQKKFTFFGTQTTDFMPRIFLSRTSRHFWWA